MAYSGGVARKVVTFACAEIGKPYVWRPARPGSYDCWGSMLAAWRKAGVSFADNARQQRGTTWSVERAHLRPGDLVFYYGDLHHVAMYVRWRLVVHAPQAGDSVWIGALRHDADRQLRPPPHSDARGRAAAVAGPAHGSWPLPWRSGARPCRSGATGPAQRRDPAAAMRPSRSGVTVAQRTGQRVGQVRQFFQARLGVGPRCPW